MSITLISKPDKHISKEENYRPISSMNIETLSKTMANQIQKDIRKIVYHD
jgi:hypothetical protein